MSLGLVYALAALLFASSSCSDKHESEGAGSGGKESGGTGGQNTSGKGGAGASGGNAGKSGGGGNGASGGASGAGAGGGGDTTQCDTAADCGYGEIDHEIAKTSDCVCLFGCPYIPLNKTTIDRRNASYEKLCDPRKDGDGKPCGVDDCVPLKAALCEDHTCRAAPR